jgi:hypothetical protein
MREKERKGERDIETDRQIDIISEGEANKISD